MVISEIVTKYNSLLEQKDLKSVSQLSELVNNELLYLIRDNLSEFYDSYLDLIKKAEEFISLGSKIRYDLDGSAHLLLNQKNKKTIKLIPAHKLYNFLKSKDQDKELEQLAILFLSNEKNIVYLNISIHSSLF